MVTDRENKIRELQEEVDKCTAANKAWAQYH